MLVLAGFGLDPPEPPAFFPRLRDVYCCETRRMGKRGGEKKKREEGCVMGGGMTNQMTNIHSGYLPPPPHHRWFLSSRDVLRTLRSEDKEARWLGHTRGPLLSGKSWCA